MATIHQMKRQELWEALSRLPQLSQREIPSAFFISFDRMFLMKMLYCVSSKNKSKVEQKEVEIITDSLAVKCPLAGEQSIPYVILCITVTEGITL